MKKFVKGRALYIEIFRGSGVSLKEHKINIKEYAGPVILISMAGSEPY